MDGSHVHSQRRSQVSHFSAAVATAVAAAVDVVVAAVTVTVAKTAFCCY